MFRLVALAVSIGFADSLNPSTIAPALYFAGGKDPRRKVTQFTTGVFVANLLGGAVIALGLGQLILSLVPRPDREDRYVLEIIAGCSVLAAGMFIWIYRHRLAARELHAPKAGRRSSALMGATISAVELPTAFPYFAVIAATVGSGLGVIQQTVALVIFNLCFIAPLIAILAILTFTGTRAHAILAEGRRRLEANWPLALAGLAVLAGAFVVLLGATGLAGLGHGHFAGGARRLRKLLTRP
jgi:cytochrome c biogenesis protein CcdA